MPRRRAPALALLAVLLIGGCTSAEPGAPAPAPAPTSTAVATPDPDEQVIDLPPRPRDVPLDGVDPCALLTPDQRAALELDGEPRPYEDTSQLTGPGDACSITGLGQRDIGFTIALNSNLGVEKFTTRAYADNGMIPIEVERFPALLTPPPDNLSSSCLVFVDVAPGQVLSTLLSPVGLPAIPIDELCRDAPRYTAAVVRTLLAERPA